MQPEGEFTQIVRARMCLRLVGDRLVLRDGEGGLLRRYGRDETVQLVALLRVMARHDKAARTEGCTPDGAVAVSRATSSRGVLILSVFFTTWRGEVSCSIFSHDVAVIARRLKRESGAAYARSSGASLDSEGRVVLRGAP